MSRILRRPMFRGGRVDSRGTGITANLGYNNGGRVGYQQAGFVTGADLLAAARAFPELNMYKNIKLNPKSKFPIGQGNTLNIGGTEIDIDRIASFTGTPGFQDLAFGDTYGLGESLAAQTGKRIDDDKNLIASSNTENLKTGKITDDEIDMDKSFDTSTLTEDNKKESPTMTMKQEELSGAVIGNDGDLAGVTETEKEDVVVEEQGSGIKEMADKYFELMGGGKAFRRDLEDTGTRLSASLIDAPSVREGLANFLKAEAKAGPSRTEKIESDATKAAINYSTQKEFLERKLENAKTIAEKQITAQKLKDLNKRFAPGIIEKNVEFITQLKPGTAKHTAALKQAGYESNIFRAANVAAQDFEGGALSATDIDTLGPIYYGKDWKGIAKPGQSEEDGVYLLEETQEIVTIVDGKPTKRQKINMLQ